MGEADAGLPIDPGEAEPFWLGLRLFNEGEWFKAHEAWEEAWKLAFGPRNPRKLFYQTLIQTAVTLEHVRRGNPRGVRSMYASVREKFERLPGRYMGVDLGRLHEDLRGAIGEVLALPGEWFEPGKGHGLELPFDENLRPRIEVEGDPFEGV
ncbi:MAG: DUF309 domain-containing protein [Phycisphaeraceae bacterium]|nr:DUF309 domain-containing protein [Phycisphaeraceae bacterium]